MQIGGSHLTAKFASILLLVGIVLSNYIPTNRNRLYTMNHSNLAGKYVIRFVILIGLGLLVYEGLVNLQQGTQKIGFL